MAVHDEELLDTTTKPKPKKKIKLPIKKMLIGFLVLLILAGAGGTAYYQYFTDKPGKIEKSSLSKEILIFTYTFMPQVHSGIKSINEEIIFTENEIERIIEIEKEYPDQEKITGSEKKIWDKNLQTLNRFLLKHEKEVKDIFVSYQVNSESGQKLIDERKEELAKASSEVITPSKVLTNKLRAIEDAKGFIDKVKDLIKNKGI